ncbi:hypothetical protein Hanom_Chr05g00398741 [Helianthus anomalus]
MILQGSHFSDVRLVTASPTTTAIYLLEYVLGLGLGHGDIPGAYSLLFRTCLTIVNDMEIVGRVHEMWIVSYFRYLLNLNGDSELIRKLGYFWLNTHTRNSSQSALKHYLAITHFLLHISL